MKLIIFERKKNWHAVGDVKFVVFVVCQCLDFLGLWRW